MSISIRRRLRLSQQRLDQLVRIVGQEERRIKQVDTDDAQRLLLQGVLGVEHPHVHDDLAVLVAGISLESHAHPAVAFVRAFIVASGNRVGEDEEAGRVAAGFLEPARFRACS